MIYTILAFILSSYGIIHVIAYTSSGKWARLIRKLYWKRVKSEITRITNDSSPLLAYPIMIQLELGTSKTVYIERGFDAFKSDLMRHVNNIANALTKPKSYSLDDITESDYHSPLDDDEEEFIDNYLKENPNGESIRETNG